MSDLKLTYIGRRLSDKKLVYAYQNKDGKVSVWSKNLKAGARVGAVLNAQESEPGSGRVYTKGDNAPTIGGYLEGDLVLEWEALDRADSTRHGKYALEARINRRQVTPFDRAVSDLREAASGMNRTSRAALIAYLIAELS